MVNKSLFKPRYPYFFAFALILLVELFSFTAYFLPSIQPFLLAASFVAVFLISIFSLENGLLIAITELVIGSKGHLFSYDIFGFPVSLRLVIWAALMTASLVFVIRKGFRNSWKIYGQPFRYWRYLLIFVLFIVIAIIQGLARNFDFTTVLSDANAWLFLSLIIPILIVYGSGDKAKLTRLQSIFFLALGWLCFKTLILLYIFSHNLNIMPDVYLWVRRSGIGEVTAMGGGWQRVFIQSQIYAPIAYFLLLWPAIKSEKLNWRHRLALGTALSVLLAVIIISMSRSFWLAFGASGALMAVFSWRSAWRRYARALAYVAASALGAALIIFIAVKFPFPNPNAGLSADALAERLNLAGDEAALASRWSQLPNLWTEIKEAPLLGQGFGATVSYFSQDPRVLANNPDGWYTTYAFEWAYLDTWLKLGLIGLLSYLLLLIIVLAGLLRRKEDDKDISLALGGGLLFLMIVNIFTPYLNHPLGLGYLLFCSCYLSKKLL